MKGFSRINVILIYFQYSSSISTLDLQISIVSILFSLKMLFICFYVGQKLHSDLMGLSDMIYQSDWHRYPPSVRRFQLLMMMRAQQPFYLSAYGVVRCTLENYIGVSEFNFRVFTDLTRY